MSVPPTYGWQIVRDLYDAGSTFALLRPGRKAAFEPRWNDPRRDLDYGTVSSHVRGGGNVGVRSGPSRRLRAPFAGWALFDPDAGHVGAMPSEVADEYRWLDSLLAEHAIAYWLTPTSGSGALVPAPWVPATVNLWPVAGGHALQVFGLGVGQKVVPPSVLDEQLEPPKPGRSYTLHDDLGRPAYRLVRLDGSDAAFDWWIDHWEDVADRLELVPAARAPSARPSANGAPAAPAPPAAGLEEIRRRLRDRPDDWFRLVVRVIEAHFGPNLAPPERRHGEYDAVVWILSALATVGASPEQIAALLWPGDRGEANAWIATLVDKAGNPKGLLKRARAGAAPYIPGAAKRRSSAYFAEAERELLEEARARRAAPPVARWTPTRHDLLTLARRAGPSRGRRA
ncbi:MAG: hypothetical protein ACLQD8_05255 [Thermoplasmata archaeon]